MIKKLLSLFVFAFAILAGLFLSRTAEKGETLYPIRILGEEIEYNLTPRPADKALLRLRQLEHDSIAMHESVNNNDIDRVGDQVTDFKDKQAAVGKQIQGIKDSGKDVASLQNNLNAIKNTVACALDDLLAQTTPENKQKVEDYIKSLAIE